MPLSSSAGDIKSCMEVSAVAHLAVPTGTAAATVIAQSPCADPATESRRFARLESLSDIAFRANFEELIVSGVYTVLHGRFLVLRVIAGNVRRFAVVASVSGTTQPAEPRAGLAARPAVVRVAAESAEASGLLGMVEAESRQRPVFHGMTPEGVTYSGFTVLHPEPLMNALVESVSTSRPGSGVTAFVIGDAIDLPPGLVVGLERARE